MAARVSRATFVVTHPEELVEACTPASRMVAEQIASDTTDRTPRETGRLAGGWRIEHVSGSRYQVVNDVPYARFVEFGTKFVRPAGMLGEATAKARNRYE